VGCSPFWGERRGGGLSGIWDEGVWASWGDGVWYIFMLNLFGISLFIINNIIIEAIIYNLRTG